MAEAQFRRMRSKCNGRDFTRESWNAGLVGVWYGAWNADDFSKLSERYDDRKLLIELTKINRQNKLSWSVSAGMLRTVWKFWAMKPRFDWVFTQFDGKIHIAQLDDSAPSGDARFDYVGEVYKSRKIVRKRSFSLSLLPDCFRLLASAGQANCHEVHGTRPLIKLLSECKNEPEVLGRWADMSLADRVDALGPKSWESICEAYLILEEQYLPMGLSTGGTLPLFDLVGRSQDGRHIHAQCKGTRNPVSVSEEFLDQTRQLNTKSRKTFFFAYAGTTNPASELDDIKVMTNKDLLSWLEEKPKGRAYVKLMAG